ncbi:MAG: molybdopterin molybdenumtransferase MoeA [Deltaproteobacteria bacterium]|nr:MAG: molybdopterin molybdenumtransferase MoeA [Deltaproteobacteria bacterium]
MIRYEEALELILAKVHRGEPEVVSLKDSFGRVIAADAPATLDHPSFDNSAMDGYAVVAESVRGASRENPVSLKFVGDVPAGGDDSIVVGPGEAARIGTGAKIPRGADTVVIVENTDFRDGQVVVYQGEPEGRHIRRAGEDFRKGDVLVKEGTVIGPPEVCYLAANGYASVSVYRRPRVGILSTGTELVPVDSPVSGTKVRDSNSATIRALAERAGAVAEVLPSLPDERDEIVRFIGERMRSFDFFVTIGGISMGAHDYVGEALEAAGAKMEFWKVAIRPGKPFGFGTAGNTLVFALPGNPVSCYITFEIFARPAIARFCGRKPPYREFITATLGEDVKKKKGLTTFVRGRIVGDAPDVTFLPYKKQGSGMISTLVECDAVFVAPEGRETVEKGERISVFRL